MFRALGCALLLLSCQVWAASFTAPPLGADTHTLTLTDLPGGNGFVVEGSASWSEVSAGGGGISWEAFTELNLPAGLYLVDQRVDTEFPVPGLLIVRTFVIPDEFAPAFFNHTGGSFSLRHEVSWENAEDFGPATATMRVESFVTLTPEPSTFALLFGGLGILILRQRWRG